jgi:hypothetical protein
MKVSATCNPSVFWMLLFDIGLSGPRVIVHAVRSVNEEYEEK